MLASGTVSWPSVAAKALPASWEYLREHHMYQVAGRIAMRARHRVSGSHSALKLVSAHRIPVLTPAILDHYPERIALGIQSTSPR